jgi:hypothetical protein
VLDERGLELAGDRSGELSEIDLLGTQLESASGESWPPAGAAATETDISVTREPEARAALSTLALIALRVSDAPTVRMIGPES